MKRHKSLYPLSHDHHHALVQARNLRIASLNPDLSSFSQTAKDFIAFWESSLERHFRQEEDILLPVFSNYSSPNQPEILETLKQHLELRRSCVELRKEISQTTGGAAEGLGLAVHLKKHIEYEETILFPAIEEMVPEEELWRVNRQLTEKELGRGIEETK